MIVITSEIIIQGIGFLAFGIFLISYQTKSNSALIILQTISSILFGIQFFLLGGISGCFTISLAVIRNTIMVVGQNKPWIKWKIWIPLFSLMAILISIITWKDYTSLLPLVASIGGTIGYWSNNAQKIRLANLVCCSPCWMLYNIFTGSIGGVINEILGLCSIVLSIYRYGWKSMGENGFD